MPGQSRVLSIVRSTLISFCLDLLQSSQFLVPAPLLEKTLVVGRYSYCYLSSIKFG